MKLMPASSAAWMIRIDSSWSVLPHWPNIIAPRQSGLTFTPVLPKLRSCMAAHLVDRREPRLESAAGGAQIEPPDACALRARKPRRLIDVVVEPPGPVAQRLGVVVAEALDVVDLETCALERERDPRQVQWVRVGEDVALAERTRGRIVVAEPCDAVVQYPAAVDDQRAELRRVLVYPLVADVLDHADAGDRIEALTADLALVLDADVHLVGHTRFGSTPARDPSLRLRQRDAGDVDVVLLRGMDHPAAPAAAHVEHALPGLQVELRADQVQLRALRLLERRRSTGEDGAAVRERLAQEQLEELWRQVVVVRHRPLVARDRVEAALRLELGGGGRGRQHRPRGANGGKRELGLRRPVDGRGLPRADDVHRRIQVVDRDVARHVSAADAELTRRAQRMANRLRRLKPEGRAAAVRGRKRRPIPELDCKRPIGKDSLDFRAKGGRAGHAPDHNDPRNQHSPDVDRNSSGQRPESGIGSAVVSRPWTRGAILAAMPPRAGVDLGGTKIQIVVVDGRNKVLGQSRVPTPSDDGPDAVVKTIAQAVGAAADEAGLATDSLIGVGVGAPGGIDPEAGILINPPNLAGFDGEFPLGSELQQQLGTRVFLGNDVSVATEAEFRLGAGKPYNSILGVFWGTGVGGGIILDGKQWTGRGSGGEIGQVGVKQGGGKCPCGRGGGVGGYPRPGPGGGKG